jgi:hypothetical protein
LLGEQIGGTLLKKAELRPKVLLTDQAAMLMLRGQETAPVVCLLGEDDNLGVATAERFKFAGKNWELPVGYDFEQSTIVELLQQLGKCVDVAEPFGRIHEAIREAQRISSGGFEAHANAA